jgi:hypothetical protein
MTEEEEQYLADVVASGKVVMWNPDPETCRRVVDVREVPVAPDDEPEPSRCAIFDNGDYAALYNCELSLFIIAERMG